MPTADGAPKIEYGGTYVTASGTAIAVTVSTTSVDYVVGHATNASAENSFKTSSAQATGVTVGKGKWLVLYTGDLTPAAGTPTVEAKILLDGTEVAGSSVSYANPSAGRFFIARVVDVTSNGAVLAPGVSNETDANNINVDNMFFVVIGLNTEPKASQPK